MAARRGYCDWKPQDEARYWVTMVGRVLREYRNHLPLSLRTVFYILVGDHGFEKTERAYNRLGTWVARARRAQMLDFTGLKDDQGRAHEVLQFVDPGDFWDQVRSQRRHYRRNRMQGQPIRAEVWSEASGIGDQLQRVAWQYGIPVYISRGYASVTNTHALAERALKFDGPTVLFHVGDYDPSGVGIYESLSEDSRAFLLQKRAWRGDDLEGERPGALTYRKMDESGPTIKPVRVALTWEQVEELGVETSPPKPSDSRSATWVGETAQAEALRPEQIEDLLTEAIENELDMERYETEVAKENDDRGEIDEVLEEVPGG